MGTPRRKVKAINAYEQDWVSHYWRSCTYRNSGTGKFIKRGMNRRARVEGKEEAAEQYNEYWDSRFTRDPYDDWLEAEDILDDYYNGLWRESVMEDEAWDDYWEYDW